ncbi:hypothetical protein [Staphylococcus equorum]|uniref:hypothetical protein n=1 Tax=Staphylococcus equorum TaxID=246432 RepID=UPI001868C2DA|nr:hypothetical protein [Staphylococcus equorum]
MGWNEEEITKRMNSLADDDPYFNTNDITLNAEDLKKRYKNFIETDEEQELADVFLIKKTNDMSM